MKERTKATNKVGRNGKKKEATVEFVDFGIARGPLMGLIIAVSTEL